VKKEGAVLSARIESELKDIFTIIDRIKIAWRKAKDTNDDFYLDSVALNPFIIVPMVLDGSLNC
jgi:hypothetical protein